MFQEPNAPQQDHPLLTRIRAEYLEMPGLRLTLAQAQRLWALDATTCEALLASLVADQFLCHAADGAYGLAANGSGFFPSTRITKVETATDARVLPGRARPSREPQRASEPHGKRPAAERRP